MAQASIATSEPTPQHPAQAPTPTKNSGAQGFLRRLLNRGGNVAPAATKQAPETEKSIDSEDLGKAGLVNRLSRRVVPGLPRVQTFKRQQSERRINLAPVEPTTDERRAVSVDRRSHEPRASSLSQASANPRASAPSFLGACEDEASRYVPSLPVNQMLDEAVEDAVDHQIHKDGDMTLVDDCAVQDTFSTADTHSITPSQYDAMVHEELENIWILNLSMHFRDRSKREKFFVTYRERKHLWRRVTISLDYRCAPPNSLEMDLIHTHYQRDKSSKIYEAIRDSLRDIQFYDTVTNLKLQTTDGRLHVHVVEDGNEIIQFPTVSQIEPLDCRRIRERDIVFDSHMSGFVYKVYANGRTLIKKEIPSPDTVDEFLYEVNALNRLRYSRSVIHFHGVVVDDNDEYVKGLLIEFADQGALIDIIYEHCKHGDYDLPWATRERWARQIVEGLSDIHESGFVQGDFTLSNIVIDEKGDAKIIDINRRGCPVGWEPPEAIPLIESHQKISMYIGVKSDLYQLGMVLWALATQEDEPETQGRPLILGPEVNIPDWYRQMAEICLNDDPRLRLQASSLLQMFPRPSTSDDHREFNPPITPVDEGYTLQQYLVNDYQPELSPEIRNVEPPNDWPSFVDVTSFEHDPYFYTRGRSPPSPLPSNYDGCDLLPESYTRSAWAANRNIPSSYSDIGPDGMPLDEAPLGIRRAPMDTEPFTPVVSTMEAVELPLTPSTFVDPSKDNGTPTPTSTAKGQVNNLAEETSQRTDLTNEERVQEPKVQMQPMDSLMSKVPATTEPLSIEQSNNIGKIQHLTDTKKTDNLTSNIPVITEPLSIEQESSIKKTQNLTDTNKMEAKREVAQEAAQEVVPQVAQEVEKRGSDGTTKMLMGEDENSEYILGVADSRGSSKKTEQRPEPELGTVKVAGTTEPESCLASHKIGPEEALARPRSEEKIDSLPDGREHQRDSGSLVGMGAVHLTNDDDTIRQKQMTDEDFNATTGPLKISSVMG